MASLAAVTGIKKKTSVLTYHEKKARWGGKKEIGGWKKEKNSLSAWGGWQVKPQKTLRKKKGFGARLGKISKAWRKEKRKKQIPGSHILVQK